MTHDHTLFVISAVTAPEHDQRQLMGCSSHGCGHVEVVCRGCITEGREKSVAGEHRHADDGTITRALTFLPKPRRVKPPN